MVSTTSVATETETNRNDNDEFSEKRRITEITCKPPDDNSEKSVTWDPDTVDNEHLNRKSSKSCCIFTGKKRCKHNSKTDDDSETDSSASETDREGECT